MSLYVTPAEFKASPTSIDTTTLDQANIGNPAAQEAALTNVLRAASAWVNRLLGMDTIEASTHTETQEVHVARDGRLNVYVNNSPILSLTDVSYTLNPSVGYVSVDTSNIQVFKRWFSIYQLDPTYSNLTIQQQTVPFMYLTPYQRQQISNYPVTVKYTYTSGYFNSTLDGNVTAGANTLTVKDATGLSAGSKFTIYDGANTEECMVSSVNGNTITLSSPLMFSHNSGVGCSAIPDAIKQATIIIAGYLIKNRGSAGIITNEIVAPGTTMGYVHPNEIMIAKELVAPYARVV